MDLVCVLFILVIVAVVVFDFTNGFHDASDMVATAIASRAIKPLTAILIVNTFDDETTNRLKQE